MIPEASGKLMNNPSTFGPKIMIKFARIKCTGERIAVSPAWNRDGFWVEIFREKKGFERYGRVFNYESLKFEKGTY